MTDAPTNERAAAPDFDADTAVTHLDDDHRFRATLRDRWNIVAGPNGGYLAAIIARAMTESSLADPSRSLRSLTVHFLARPEFGDVEIDVEILRTGRSVSSVRAMMRQGDRPVCSSLAAFSVPWTTTDEWRLPISPHADDAGIDLRRDVPPVARNWSGRPIVDAPFFSGEGSARIGQWIRAATPRPLDALELVAISDALPPAGFPRMTTPGSMPTVDLTVHIRVSLPRPGAAADEPVYAECNTHHVADGFAEEDCHIWAADGTLLAQSRQLAITR